MIVPARLGITSETRANISNVLFQDCDIIHDLGNCCSLAVLVSDSGTMSDIRFEDIRIEDERSSLMDCWVGSDMWGHDKTRGHINGVIFRNILVTGQSFPGSRLSGFDGSHLVENLTFENLRINDKPIDSLVTGKFHGQRICAACEVHGRQHLSSAVGRFSF